MIRLRVPAVLARRDLVLLAVTEACAIAAARGFACDRRFASELVSAVSEAFNNIVLHGHDGGAAAWIDLSVELDAEAMRVVFRDGGKSFDIRDVPARDVTELSESGMGVFIIRSFVDEVRYFAGAPNCLVLSKRFTG